YRLATTTVFASVRKPKFVVHQRRRYVDRLVNDRRFVTGIHVSELIVIRIVACWRRCKCLHLLCERGSRRHPWAQAFTDRQAGVRLDRLPRAGAPRISLGTTGPERPRGRTSSITWGGPGA